MAGRVSFLGVCLDRMCAGAAESTDAAASAGDVLRRAHLLDAERLHRQGAAEVGEYWPSWGSEDVRATIVSPFLYDLPDPRALR